jgi:hypothetical protein
MTRFMLGVIELVFTGAASRPLGHASRCSTTLPSAR